MKCRLTAVVAVAVLVGPLATMLGADLSANEVRTAIRNGVKCLERQQKPNGRWDNNCQRGGSTALCTLALLNAGVKPNDPNDNHVARALSNLALLDLRETYSLSLQTMALCRARFAGLSRQNPGPAQVAARVSG